MISRQNIVVLFLVAFCTFFLSRMLFTPNLFKDLLLAIAVSFFVYAFFFDETKLKDDEEKQEEEEVFGIEHFTTFPDEPLDQQPLDEVAPADVEAEKSKPKRQRKKKAE